MLQKCSNINNNVSVNLKILSQFSFIRKNSNKFKQFGVTFFTHSIMVWSDFDWTNVYVSDTSTTETEDMTESDETWTDEEEYDFTIIYITENVRVRFRV